MADGTATRIDQIAVGDQVGAYNPDTDQVEAREVEAIFVHENVATWTVSTDDGDITTTAAHPFYVTDQGWTPAEELRAGDQLRTNDGKVATVITVAAIGDTTTVHNFTVTQLHNYRVATEDGTWILVHNAGLGEACGVEVPTPNSGPVTMRPPRGATAQEVSQVRDYVEGCNRAMAAGVLSPAGRVSTAGDLRSQASQPAAAERRSAAAAGSPYLGVAGRVPDTTSTGIPVPSTWMDMTARVNSSLGGQTNGYPVGFKPTEFFLGE